MKENGIYESSQAKFFICNGKIMMKILGRYYKTTPAFLQDAKKIAPLTEGMETNFERAFERADKW